MIPILGGALAIPPNLPQYALSLASASSQYMWMSDANFGAFNRSTFAIYLLHKRASTGNYVLYNKGSGSSNAVNEFTLQFSLDSILFRGLGASSVIGQLQTSATFTSTSSYYSIYAIFDVTQPTLSDRMQLFVDGSRINSFSVESYPTTAIATKSNNVNIGALGTPASFCNGLDYQLSFFSGSYPSIGQIYNGHPLPVAGTTGLWSYLDVRGGDVTHDGVLSAAWNNVNGVTASSNIPT
jgi:hypothetical protein